MHEMKYIAYEGQMHQEIVIFPSSRSHGEFARLLGIRNEDILGAGKVLNHGGALSCYGESRDLEVKARAAEDLALLLSLIGR